MLVYKLSVHVDKDLVWALGLVIVTTSYLCFIDIRLEAVVMVVEKYLYALKLKLLIKFI